MLIPDFGLFIDFFFIFCTFSTNKSLKNLLLKKSINFTSFSNDAKYLFFLTISVKKKNYNNIQS